MEGLVLGARMYVGKTFTFIYFPKQSESFYSSMRTHYSKEYNKDK